jgi:hypothetical protein
MNNLICFLYIYEKKIEYFFIYCVHLKNFCIIFLLFKKMRAPSTPSPMPRPTTPPGAPMKRYNSYAEVVMGSLPPCIAEDDEDEDEFPSLEKASLPVIPFGDHVGLVDGDEDDDEDDEDDDVDPDVEVEFLEASIDKEVQNLDGKVKRTKPKEKPKKKRKIPETLAVIKLEKQRKADQNEKKKRKKKKEEGEARDVKIKGNVGPYI